MNTVNESLTSLWQEVGYWIIVGTIPVAVYLLDKYKARITKFITDYIIQQVEGIDEEIIRRYRKINENLIKLLVEMGSDRVYIVEFHNGQKFATQQPIWKMSMTYEYCRPGISSEMGNMQNLPISGVVESISPLWGGEGDGFTRMTHLCAICKNGAAKGMDDYPGTAHAARTSTSKSDRHSTSCLLKGVILVRVDDLTECFFKANQNMSGVKYVVMSPLVYDGQVIGYLAAAYCSAELFESLSTEATARFNTICKEATTLSYYLVNKKLTDKKTE